MNIVLNKQTTNKRRKGYMLMIIFIISIAVLLFCIMKLKLNVFVALLAVAVGTGIACGMPLMTTTVDGITVEGIGTIIQNNFGSHCPDSSGQLLFFLFEGRYFAHYLEFCGG